MQHGILILWRPLQLRGVHPHPPETVPTSAAGGGLPEFGSGGKFELEPGNGADAGGIQRSTPAQRLLRRGPRVQRRQKLGVSDTLPVASAH